MSVRGLRSSVIGTLLLLICACGDSGKPAAEQAQPAGPDPLDTVRELLSLHGLVGKQPEERSEETRDKEVGRDKLKTLFKDLHQGDSFTSDLYVGFVVGALARNQGRLYVARRGSRAEVTAGDVRVVLTLDGGKWKIVLADSIPDEIKKKAAEEKTKFDDARKNALQN